MTREELIEKVARALNPDMWKEHDQRGNMSTSIIISKRHAEDAINAIFASIEKPTKEMQKAWSNISKPHTSTKDWRAMLSASPLAPKEEVTIYDELNFADRVALEYKEFIEWCDANTSFDLDCRLHTHSGKIGKGGYISDEKTRIAFAAWRAAKNAIVTSPLAPEGR